MPKTLLITGGAGYIGSHATVAFTQAGYRVVVIDNFSNSSCKSLDAIEEITGKKVSFYEGDIRDEAFLKHVFAQHHFEGVIHFAGLKSVGESCQDPYSYHDNNITGSIHLFKQMEENGVKNIIFSSSACVYAPTQGLPVNETHPLGASNPYGTTKIVIEELLQDFARHKNFRVIALRYFNPIGAHESGKIGESPKGIPNNLVPYIYEVATGKREKLGVFGNDYDTPDGTGVRDYIDVNDLVEAHLAATKKLEETNEACFEVVNVGTGKGVSVLEMVKATEKAIGRDIPYQILPRREGDLGDVHADVQKAKAFLGWSAKRDIEESLKNGWNFAKEP